eukprot:5665466-Pyramimonas_sp.AAC.1
MLITANLCFTSCVFTASLMAFSLSLILRTFFFLPSLSGFLSSSSCPRPSTKVQESKIDAQGRPDAVEARGQRGDGGTNMRPSRASRGGQQAMRGRARTGGGARSSGEEGFKVRGYKQGGDWGSSTPNMLTPERPPALRSSSSTGLTFFGVIIQG